jgi:hypothetical protein
MNVYKKAIIMAGVTLVAVPQLCNALDAKGDTVANSIKLAYATTISSSHLSNPNTEYGKWDNVIRNTVYPYVIENSSVAGIKDTLLVNSLNALTTNSSKLITQLPTVRGGLLLKGEKQIYAQNLMRCITDLTAIRDSIKTTSTRLRAEKYYVTNKKNAQEILLLSLDRIQQTAEDAINLLNIELKQRK